MREIVKYSGCFVCGDKNPTGLKVRFFADGDGAVGECVAEAQYQGYRNIFHGGIVAALLDEIMAKAILAQGVYPLTAEMKVRFRKAVPTGQKIKFVGRITSRRGRLFETVGELRSPEGELFASSTGKYVEASGAMHDALLESLE